MEYVASWAMLKNRLLFGILMTVLFAGIVVLDGWLDGALTPTPVDNTAVQGTLLAILLAATLSGGGLELARLAAARGLVVLNPVTTVGLILISTAWYWPQLIPIAQGPYLSLVLAAVLAGLLVLQNARFGVTGSLANCGISCFTLLYLGLLGAFVLAIRIHIGLWPVLMYIFVVKTSDTGAYTTGKLFGRHKLAPRVSPGKTWEGLAGAVVVAIAVSLAFVLGFGIMKVWLAPVFGACMAVIGQLSDLAESILKRDAQQKDSSNRVPGFGGILDVIDSPLFAAPSAYLFFRLVA
jgi:phosphatidate cytidylyltransferase